MARKAATKQAAPGRKVGPRSGMVRVMFSITPEQDEALGAEALRRATAQGSRKLDASAVVREALSAWMKRR